MGLIYFPGSGYRQTDVFGDRNGSHYGIDFAAPEGTDIPAAANGVVWRSGYSATAGFYVIIKHTGADGNEFYTAYEHMQEGSQTKNVGEIVKPGETIGKVSNTGCDVNGCKPHLHFEVIDPKDTGIAPSEGEKGTKEEDGAIGIDGYINRIDPDKFNNWPLGGPYDGGVCSDPNYHERSFFQRLYDWLGIPSIPDSFSRFFTWATQWRPSRDPLTLRKIGSPI